MWLRKAPGFDYCRRSRFHLIDPVHSEPAASSPVSLLLSPLLTTTAAAAETATNWHQADEAIATDLFQR